MTDVVQYPNTFRNETERQAFLNTISAAVPHVETLDEVKSKRYAYINAEREVARYSDVTANGHTWQADISSVDLLSGAIIQASCGQPLPPVWRTSDNVNVAITSISDLLTIAAAIAQSTQAAYYHSWDLKKQVDDARDLQSVAAVIW